MRCLQYTFLSLGLMLALGACSGKPGEAPTGDATQGRVLAEQYCQRCHAIGPEGPSNVAAAPPFRDVVKRIQPEDLAEALGEGIQVSHAGQVQMPEMTFEPEQVDDLIAYLQTLQKK